MTYDEKLDLILANQATMAAEIADLKNALEEITGGAPPAQTPPAQTGGLYNYVRPAVRDTTQWPKDVDMTTADANEAFQRSLHGVNWRGGAVADVTYEEAWAEIEVLKAGTDPALTSKYVMLDPEFAGFGLTTNLFAPTKYDAITFGVNVSNRERWAGYTIQSFISEQITISQSGGAPSGE